MILAMFIFYFCLKQEDKTLHKALWLRIWQKNKVQIRSLSLWGFLAKQFLRCFQSFKYGKVWVRNEVCRKFKRVFITPLTLLCLISVLRDGWDHLKFQPHMVKSLGTHHQIGWEDFFFRGHQKPRRAICWQKTRILVQRQIMSFARRRRWYNRFNGFPLIVS